MERSVHEALLAAMFKCVNDDDYLDGDDEFRCGDGHYRCGDVDHLGGDDHYISGVMIISVE